MSIALIRRALRRAFRTSRPPARPLGLALLALAALAPQGAHATPAYARQTGNACADCHAGAYGPALTPYGMRFKLNGYTDTGGKGGSLPLAVQLIGTHTVPERGDSHTELTEADLYLAGRLTDHVGGYVKVETDNTGNDHFHTKLSNVDVRFVAKELKLGDHDAMMGVSINNSPGFEDPIGALPNAANFGPPAISGTVLNPSSPNALATHVIGAVAYGMLDNSWLGEIGSYASLPLSTQSDVGYAPSSDPGKLSDTGYLRLAYMKDLKRQFFSAGVVALTTKRKLPRTGPADDITDLGYDLSYQYLGNREHIVQLSYVNILEQRDYGSVFVAPFAPGTGSKRSVSGRDQTLSLTYTFRQSYGVTLAHLKSTGTNDPVRYPPFGDPSTTSNLITLFWAPFGKEDSYTSMANLKIAATWFRFTRFNGVSDNIFGAPPGTPATNARDLDQFSISASLAF
jgi:hypothetical protein